MPPKTPNSVTSLASVIILSKAYTAQLGEIWYLASFWSVCVTNSFPFHENGLMALLLVGSMVGAGEILSPKTKYKLDNISKNKNFRA